MPTLFLSKTSEPIRSARLKFIDSRWEQLLRIEEEAELRVLRYLTFANAGGAAATLSFLGASQEARKLVAPRFGLGLFVFGLILVGVLLALSYHRFNGLLEGWKHDTQKFMADGIPWGQLIDMDSNRVKKGELTLQVIAYSAFGCFILGTTTGVWALFST